MSNTNASSSNTPKYDFNIAKDVLSQGDKDRVLAIYLNTDENGVNWQAATTAFGSKSVESMKVSTRNILKKLEAAGAATGGVAGVGPASAGGKGKKRKAPAAAAAAEEEEDDEEEEKKPKPKKRGRPAKKAAAGGSEDGARKTGGAEGEEE